MKVPVALVAGGFAVAGTALATPGVGILTGPAR
jgi:hypothetical protein